MSDRRYPALRFVATLLKASGIVCAIGGIIMLLTRTSAGFVMALGLVMSGIVTFAIGEAVYVLVDIEANTRSRVDFRLNEKSTLTSEQRALLDD